MTAPNNKTMLNYFTKLPTKAFTIEETNPRKLAPVYNKQHVEEFQKDRLEQFDAELFNVKNLSTPILSSSIDAIQEDHNSSAEVIIEDNDTPRPNYLASIRSGQYIPFRVKLTPRGLLRSKLLQYSEDVRPPYFGTWQKKSKRITGRRPWARDEIFFDYEADSEAEWDIGGPGESLKGDDSEDDEELDDYEIDMKCFVPHGYVSDDEIEAHSDQEENEVSNETQGDGQKVNQEIGEDSNASVKIIGEKRMKLTTISSANCNNHANNNSSNNQTTGNNKRIQLTSVSKSPPRQTKLDIKPIVLGIYYENQHPAPISESKIHFLKGFQGTLCNID